MGSHPGIMNSESVIQFQTPALVGYYKREIPCEPLTGKLEDMLRALNSSLPTSNVVEPGFSCATTGDCAPLGDHGHVFLLGQPYYKDSELAATATGEGPAAAISRAYQASANNFLQEIHGEFSFCIIDDKHDRVIVGTDRFGRYPLYYRLTANGISWGTSAAPVMALKESSAEITAQGVYNYVYFHMVPAPTAIFEDLKKLPAAHCLRYESGKASLKRYWQPQFREQSDKPFELVGTELKPVLRASVTRAMNGSPNVGAFLSGGLDSSTVAGMLAEESGGQAKAFSIGFEAEGYDEMPFARITARHFGLKLHEYYVTPDDVVAALPLVATSYDEPFGNSSALPAYFCARLAADNGIERLLAGDGGDELFAGNERYARQSVFDHYARIPLALRRNLVETVLRALPNSLPLIGKANSYIQQANTPLPDRLQSYNFLHRHSSAEIFTEDFLAEIRTQEPLELQREIYNAPANAGQLNRMLYLDWQFTLADNDLRKVSHMCSMGGVEVAYPMLDDELVEFSCQIPSEWKLRGGALRHFYKEALKSWLPRETIEKRKQGFGLPFGVWMKTHKPLQDLAYDNLSRLRARGYLRPDFIDQTIELHRSTHAAYYGELVWVLTVLELWLDEHLRAK
jgi:asparagine synthase (glutamine-hydrolysing)